MDFSEYTLISFGDSFTFGQDTVFRDVLLGEPYDNKKWKSECNGQSYTQVLCDKMGFKDNLNFGIPGSSTERSLMMLEAFLRQNPTLKVFVLFSFTESLRCLNMGRLNSAPTEYDIVEMSTQINQCEEEKMYVGITEKSIENYYTYFRNDAQEIYQHIKDKRMLYYMLASRSIPHVTFDLLNTIDYRMIQDNPLQHINESVKDTIGLEYMYSADENYVFTEMDYFNSYYRELMEDTSLLSHIGIDYLNGERNATLYLRKLGDERYENYPDGYYTSEFGCHWSSEGHIEVAKLIEKYINKNHN